MRIIAKEKTLKPFELVKEYEYPIKKIVENIDNKNKTPKKGKNKKTVEMV